MKVATGTAVRTEGLVRHFGDITAVVVFLGFWLAMALGLVVWMIDAVLFWLGARIFRRDALFARL